MILHLGVVDIPYVEQEKVAQARKRVKAGKIAPPRPKSVKVETTGDVAEVLEGKYGVMQAFYNHHEKDIVESLEDSLGGALENLLMSKGAGLTKKLLEGSASGFAEAESDIKDKFSQFLSQREVEQMGIPGVPTKAALEGHSHRFKQPYKKRARRPSFVDTGLYEASFAAWID